MDTQISRKNTRLPGYDYNTPGAYFLTICTENRRCILSRIKRDHVIDGPDLVLLPHGKVAEKYLKQISDFYDFLSVGSYVVMPNHIHILLLVNNAANLSGTTNPTLQNSIVSRFVSTFKRFCNKEYGHNIWQARSYDHVIRDQSDYDRHLQYIHNNPYGWEKDEFYIES
jgi:REP element-mobilizing transposase RayT